MSSELPEMMQPASVCPLKNMLAESKTDTFFSPLLVAEAQVMGSIYAVCCSSPASMAVLYIVPEIWFLCHLLAKYPCFVILFRVPQRKKWKIKIKCKKGVVVSCGIHETEKKKKV